MTVTEQVRQKDLIWLMWITKFQNFLIGDEVNVEQVLQIYTNAINYTDKGIILATRDC
jgi:hypothetical protein